jgi:S-methylmethionine-dependent homocysteine/selenocysteine methylase
LYPAIIAFTKISESSHPVGQELKEIKSCRAQLAGALFLFFNAMGLQHLDKFRVTAFT